MSPEPREPVDASSLGREATGAVVVVSVAPAFGNVEGTAAWLDALVLVASDGGRKESLTAVKSWLGLVGRAFRDIGF